MTNRNQLPPSSEGAGSSIASLLRMNSVLATADNFVFDGSKEESLSYTGKGIISDLGTCTLNGWLSYDWRGNGEVLIHNINAVVQKPMHSVWLKCRSFYPIGPDIHTRITQLTLLPPTVGLQLVYLEKEPVAPPVCSSDTLVSYAYAVAIKRLPIIEKIRDVYMFEPNYRPSEDELRQWYKLLADTNTTERFVRQMVETCRESLNDYPVDIDFERKAREYAQDIQLVAKSIMLVKRWG